MGVDVGMFVKIKGKENFLSQKKVWDLSYRICEAFGVSEFWLQKQKDDWGGPRHALEIVERYEQDGPDVEPESDEQIVEIHTLNRYYGEGYERGPLPFILCTAWWLEEAIPHAEVYYGGDSSGMLAEKFGKERREELFKHFVKVGHMPYRAGWENINEMTGKEQARRWCDFCDKPMVQYGFGPSYMAFICHGCGKQEKTDDNGVTWAETKE